MTQRDDGGSGSSGIGSGSSGSGGGGTMRTAFAPDLFSGVAPRAQLYKEEAVIGNGAYGTVYKARDINDPSRYVALKKVRIPMNEDGVPVSILREISLVRQLDRFEHPNIVRFLDVCHGPATAERNLVLFLVFEYVERDLARYIREARGDDLSPPKVKDIMFQILCGVDFLHSQRIVHRDLKPQNLLISRSGQVKLADFGLAKVYDFTMRLTSVVVTLWYRSPEVLLGCTYASPVDMWSVGCIFAELIRRRPLFPGATERDQLEKIFDIIGTPTEAQWPKDSKVLPQNFSPRLAHHFETLFEDVDDHGIDLLEKMLLFNPLERINARTALDLPYFEKRAKPEVVMRLPAPRAMIPTPESRKTLCAALSVSQQSGSIAATTTNTSATLSTPPRQKFSTASPSKLRVTPSRRSPFLRSSRTTSTVTSASATSTKRSSPKQRFHVAPPVTSTATGPSAPSAPTSALFSQHVPFPFGLPFPPPPGFGPFPAFRPPPGFEAAAAIFCRPPAPPMTMGPVTTAGLFTVPPTPPSSLGVPFTTSGDMGPFSTLTQQQQQSFVTTPYPTPTTTTQLPFPFLPYMTSAGGFPLPTNVPVTTTNNNVSTSWSNTGGPPIHPSVTTAAAADAFFAVTSCMGMGPYTPNLLSTSLPNMSLTTSSLTPPTPQCSPTNHPLSAPAVLNSSSEESTNLGTSISADDSGYTSMIIQ